MSISLIIKPINLSGQEQFPVEVEGSMTVNELKETLAAKVSLPQENIRLISSGRVWECAASISSYEPSNGTMVHLLNNPPRPTPTGPQTLAEVDPLQQMMGTMPPMGGNSGDPMQQMMQQSQQMLRQNPEMMRQIMESPMVQQMMSNPETMRAMMRMNPQMSEMMDRNPQIARILDDPETMQQAMRAATNPSLMREMMRNSDLAMGRADVMPGGHAALTRMHNEVVNPLMNAMGPQSQGGNGTAVSYELENSTTAAPNSAALPNPWGPPPAAAPAAQTSATPQPTATAQTVPQTTPTATAGTPPPMANPFAMMTQNMQNPQTAQASPMAQ